MLIKIEAIVREEKMEDVKAALNEIQVNGFTVTQLMGCGTQRGYKIFSYEIRNAVRIRTGETGYDALQSEFL